MTWKMPVAGAQGSHIHQRVQEAPRGRLGHACAWQGDCRLHQGSPNELGRTRSGRHLSTELGAGISVVLGVGVYTHFWVTLKALQTVYLAPLQERHTLLPGRRREGLWVTTVPLSTGR